MSNSSCSEEFEKVDRSSSGSQAEDMNNKDPWTPVNDTNASGNNNDNCSTDLLSERMSTAQKDAPKNLREFYISSHDIFEKVEELRGNLRTRTHQLPASYQFTSKEKAELVERAKDYTSLLFRHLEAMAKEESNTPVPDKMRDRGRIFDLCERVCFSNNDAIAAREVRQWLNFHWPLYTNVKEVIDIDSEDEELVLVDHTDLNNCPDDDDDNSDNDTGEDNEKTKQTTIHWSLIQRQLLRGNIQRVIDLLELCVIKSIASTQGHLQHLVTLLKSKPPLPITPSSSLEYQQQVTDWAEWTRKRDLAHDAFKHMEGKKEDADLKEIKALFDIVCGDTEAIAKASRGSILEGFVGLLVFCEPIRKQCELGAVGDLLLQLLQKREDDSESTDAVTAACFYILMRDWDNALNAYDDFWLQTHLGHLLTTATLLEDDATMPDSDWDYEQCTSPVQFITHIYAQDIANGHDMWSQAVSYIASCTTNREYWAAQLLHNKISMSDKDGLMDLLELCSKQRLRKPRMLVCEALADKYDSRGDVKNAIRYYATAHNTSSLDRIADRVLLQYLNDGVLNDLTPTDEDILERATKSKRFAFLIQYTRFKKYLEDHRYVEATQIAKALQQTLDAPEGFKVKLIQDITPILDASSERVFFDPQDTFDMIKHLQCIEHIEASTFTDLRQKLSLNLAHAFLVVS